MKPLSDAINDYITLRRGLGFKLYHETWVLPAFAAFLKAHGEDVITANLALRFAQQPAEAHPSWWASKLGIVRRFASYMQAFEPRTQVPAAALLPHRSSRAIPHLYRDDEVAAVLREAAAIPQPLQAATYSTLIGLLAVTGMRVGEAIALELEDVDWRQEQLVVRFGKFRKARLIPLHASVMTQLTAYAGVRDRFWPRGSSPSFFVSRVGKRLVYNNVHRTFRRLVKQAQLTHRPGRPPRLHDLRHTFAVTTLRDWYQAGIDVEPRLYSLSTYLGHVSPSSTYWYLTATPALLGSAAERLQRSLGGEP